MTTHFGLYRAAVKINNDPTGHLRIKVSCPDLCGPNTTGWVKACIPVPGVVTIPGVGSGTVVNQPPPLGSVVWVMCEMGDPDHLVWLGALG